MNPISTAYTLSYLLRKVNTKLPIFCRKNGSGTTVSDFGLCISGDRYTGRYHPHFSGEVNACLRARPAANASLYARSKRYAIGLTRFATAEVNDRLSYELRRTLASLSEGGGKNL